MLAAFACTIPIAVIGLVFLPGTPDAPSTRFLTKDEVELAHTRMISEK